MEAAREREAVVLNNRERRLLNTGRPMGWERSFVTRLLMVRAFEFLGFRVVWNVEARIGCRALEMGSN